MLEMFLSALMLPVSESKAWVEVRSDGAAALCAASNLNSRTDERGLYFGKDLLTNNEILLDLNTLAIKTACNVWKHRFRKNFYFFAVY